MEIPNFNHIENYLTWLKAKNVTRNQPIFVQSGHKLSQNYTRNCLVTKKLDGVIWSNISEGVCIYETEYLILSLCGLDKMLHKLKVVLKYYWIWLLHHSTQTKSKNQNHC